MGIPVPGGLVGTGREKVKGMIEYISIVQCLIVLSFPCIPSSRCLDIEPSERYMTITTLYPRRALQRGAEEQYQQILLYPRL
jgi:hypothetical protein